MKFKEGDSMNEYKAVLEALSEAECVIYYAGDKEATHKDTLRDFDKQLRAMIETWHALTGVTL